MHENETSREIPSAVAIGGIEALEEQFRPSIDLYKRLVGSSKQDDDSNSEQVACLTKRLEEMSIAGGTLEERRHELEGEMVRCYQNVDREKCSQWCSVYHQRLPREIRDMIYRFMLSLGTMKDVVSAIESPERYGPTPVPFNMKNYQYLDSNVVSRLFLTELLAIMYNTMRWRLSHPAHIKIFLERSPFEGVGLPLTEIQPWALVQQLSIVLPCTKVREDYLNYLEPLKFLECKTAVGLVLTFGSWDPRGPARVFPLLDEIAPWIFQMKESGFELKVTTCINGLFIDYSEYIGESQEEFEKWKLTWPRRGCYKASKAFLAKLAEDQKGRLGLPRETEGRLESRTTMRRPTQ